MAAGAGSALWSHTTCRHFTRGQPDSWLQDFVLHRWQTQRCTAASKSCQLAIAAVRNDKAVRYQTPI